jgi:hypothetical protein
VAPIYIPAVWNIRIPPKIQLFLWLLSHNKLATVDNLNRKGMHKNVHSVVSVCNCESYVEQCERVPEFGSGI